MEPDDKPMVARKQIVARDKKPDSGFSKVKASSGRDSNIKMAVYAISIVLGLLFTGMALVSCPIAPLGKVKEDYQDGYEFLADEDKRLYMREGSVNLTLKINTTSLTQGLKKQVVIGWHSYFLMAVVFGLGPVSFYEVSRRKRIDKIESRLSDFLRDISESMRAGQTLHEAIKTSSGGEYGNLTPEIRKMAMQVSWGVSASKALEMFSDRVDTPLVKRAVTLINEASSAGGNVSNVIDAAAKDTREIQIMKRTRATEMNMYTYVIGISFLVFLVVIGIMFATFMPRMMELSESYSSSDSGGQAQAPGGFDPTNVDFEEMKLLFFAAAAIQAIGDGVVGGLMSSGRIWNGLQMSAVFALATWLIFDLVLL
jgi:flagellar protein FlaJ